VYKTEEGVRGNWYAFEVAKEASEVFPVAV